MTDQPLDSLSQHCSVPGIFWAFLRLGLTAFGGPAMASYIGEMAVAKRQWLSRQAFNEGVAIAQTIPGATAMQIAGYVGLRLRGVAGAAAAYAGFGLPAFVLMVILSAIYERAHSLPVSVSVFSGLQLIVIAIVARATFTFGKTTMKGWRDCLIAVAATCYFVLRGNPILAIAAGALAGAIIYRRGVGVDAAGSETEELPSTTRPALAIASVGIIVLAVLFVADRRLFDIGALMARVDMCAFGGGFASIPVMLHLVTGNMHWMSTGAFMDGIAIGQVTPGPIVITATFVGYHVAAIAGAAVATVFVFLPSFVILVLAVPHFDRLKRRPLLQSAIRGVLASFVGLLLSVAIRFALAVPWSPVSVLFAIAAFVALMLGVDVPWVVLPGAVLSTAIF